MTSIWEFWTDEICILNFIQQTCFDLLLRLNCLSNNYSFIQNQTTWHKEIYGKYGDMLSTAEILQTNPNQPHSIKTMNTDG